MNQSSESKIAALAKGYFIEGVLHNADPSKLYEEAILFDNGQITQSGGLASFSSKRTCGGAMSTSRWKSLPLRK